MPEHADPPAGADPPADLDQVADRLYGLPPGDFVPARDEAVAQARAGGDRELARAIGKLRRPTRAAWLANLLARHRAEQVEGLAGLAAGLADAQRSLDGAALRELSSRRHRLVAAMARDAGRLAREAGEPAGEPVLRELQGILEAALARPEVAAEVRAGRLTRAISYSGFGPESDAGTWVAPPRPVPVPRTEPADGGKRTAERDRAAERERAAAAQRRAAAEREVADAEREAADARARQEDAQAARDAARERHEAVRERVAELTAELDRARDDERAGGAEVRATATAARDAVRAAGTAAARAERARARLADL